MNLNDNGRNGNQGLPIQVDEPFESGVSPASTESSHPEVNGVAAISSPAGFATRASVKDADGINKSKLVLLGGGLAIAVLFFAFTAVIGRHPRRQAVKKQLTQQTESGETKQSRGSVTPLMEAVRTPAPDNASGQLGPGDIRRTRSSEGGTGAQLSREVVQKPAANKPGARSSLANIPSFAETQQKWEEPQPYGGPSPAVSQTQQNALKEPSLIFVRSQAQGQVAAPAQLNSDDGAPLLDVTPGTRIQAKLETQISSAVQAPVVAIVEYTYAIGDKIVVPAGARVYGQLQQADRSGLVGVKFDEIELLDGAREKIDAIGTGLDLGPIKGNVFGKNTGKNFLVRAASGLGSVLAEVADNNSSAAFSEDDMLRERVAENIGTAGDSEVMNLNANSRVVVSVPADTKIYIVFTKHELGSPELHKVANASP